MISVYSFRFDLFNENTYLIYGNDRAAVLVDPGCYTKEEITQVEELITFSNLDLRFVINTHCHIDHALGNSYFTEKYNVPLYLHEKEYSTLKNLPDFAAKIRLDYRIGDFKLQFVKQGDMISFGENSLSVIESPGHSPGSVSYLTADHRAIFSGDVIFKGRVGKTDLLGSNYNQLIETVRSKIFTLDPLCKIYPGHGPATFVGDEIKFNKLQSGLF